MKKPEMSPYMRTQTKECFWRMARWFILALIGTGIVLDALLSGFNGMTWRHFAYLCCGTVIATIGWQEVYSGIRWLWAEFR